MPTNLGRALRNVATVRLALADPQGFAADITIQGIRSNRAAATCGSSSICVPEARRAGAGALSVLPQARVLSRGLDKGGRTLRITYTATVPQTGLSCTGTLDICSGTTRFGAPLQCAPFQQSGVSRSVLGC